MSTVNDLVRRVLTKLRVYQPGEDITSHDFNDVLTEMNAFLNSLSNEKLAGPWLTRFSHTLVSGDGSYTIASSGANITSPIPARIEHLFIRDSAGNDTVLQQIGRGEYNEITLKTTQSEPCVYYYEQGPTFGTIYLFPTPTAGVLYGDAWLQFTNYTNPSDNVVLPDGYDDLIVYNTCIRCASDFGAVVTPEIYDLAKKSMYRLKFVNCLDIPIMKSWGTGSNFDIVRGY
jgi:hypothetical protein